MVFDVLLFPFSAPENANAWLWVVAIVMGLLLLIVNGLGLFKHAERQPAGRVQQGICFGLIAITLITAVSYFYGLRSQGSWLHRWDIFHTVMSAKYQEELGYFGLYECALSLDATDKRLLWKVKRVRDLKTHAIRSSGEVIRDSDCPQRFSPERKAEFLADLAELDALHPRWKGMLRDKGYNGTPVHTAMQRLIWGVAPFNHRSITIMALIDVGLICLALGVVGRVFGWPLMLIAGLFFFTNFMNRYTHMGGSILRFDYIAALMMAMAALKKERHATAGGLMAYAVMSRIFPLTFVAAYGLYALLLSWRERRISSQALAYAQGFLFVGGGLFLWSLWAAGGLDTWRDWCQNMLIHSGKTAGYRIGFPHLFMMQGNLLGTEGFVSFPDKAIAFASMKGWWLAICLLWLSVAAWSGRNRDVLTFTVMIGLLAFFLTSVATRYYYSVLVLIVLMGINPLQNRGAQRLVAGLFLISALGFGALHLNGFRPWVYNTVLSITLTGYFALATFWLTGLSLKRVRSMPRAGTDSLAAHENNETSGH